MLHDLIRTKQQNMIKSVIYYEYGWVLTTAIVPSSSAYQIAKELRILFSQAVIYAR